MMECGSSSTIITNELGTVIQGATVGGVAESVRDPLEANALYLSQGQTSVMLVSCDFGGLEPRWTVMAREAMAAACGVPARSILIGSTHTGGPSIIPTNYRKAVDEAYLDRVVAWLTDLARRAVEAAAPAVVRYGQGRARIGYNRRCCWADGTHTMNGDTSREDFMGMEGPDDPTHTFIGI
jgi:neutral ceramidase